MILEESIVVAVRADSPIKSAADLVERLTHYFETYKLVPGRDSKARVARAYGFEHAAKVIRAAVEDYGAEFGG